MAKKEKYNRVEEIEMMEHLVWSIHAPNYIGYPVRDFQLEKVMDDKVLYYLKLGMTSKDLIKKYKKILIKRKGE